MSARSRCPCLQVLWTARAALHCCGLGQKLLEPSPHHPSARNARSCGAGYLKPQSENSLLARWQSHHAGWQLVLRSWCCGLVLAATSQGGHAVRQAKGLLKPGQLHANTGVHYCTKNTLVGAPSTPGALASSSAAPRGALHSSGATRSCKTPHLAKGRGLGGRHFILLPADPRSRNARDRPLAAHMLMPYPGALNKHQSARTRAPLS